MARGSPRPNNPAPAVRMPFRGYPGTNMAILTLACQPRRMGDQGSVGFLKLRSWFSPQNIPISKGGKAGRAS